MDLNKIYTGDAREVLKTFDDNCFDSIVTDPPYGIGFMGKAWDTFKTEYLQEKREVESKRRLRTDGRKSTGFGDSVYAGTYDLSLSGNIKYQQWYFEIMKEAIRVLKPGGHIISACGTRTYHRMACAIEDAGFEIRDVITWHYGSGFPKSLDISKQIDKQAGAEREVTGEYEYPDGNKRYVNTRTGNGVIEPLDSHKKNPLRTAPSTESAKEWEGWGTALKPATEFWTLARKPLSENTVAENVLKHGTGGINIDGCRIETEEVLTGGHHKNSGLENRFFKCLDNVGCEYKHGQGRFPSNLILDEFTAGLLDEQSGILTSGTVSPEGFKGKYTANIYGTYANNQINPETVYGDTGGASRFFYCAKADRFERNKGLKDFERKEVNKLGSFGDQENFDCPDGANRKGDKGSAKMQNFHPTVKPIDLMRYLVKLITPKGGICCDPFCGSGTTLIACKLELINYIGIDMNDEYCKISEARVAAWNPEKYIKQELFD